MRILHVTHYYPPETHGGTQSYVAELAALQQARGDEVSVFAGSRAHSDEGRVIDTVDAGVATRRVERNLQTEGLSGDLGCERIGSVIEKTAEQLSPDLVHVHHWFALTNDIVRRLKARGLKVVLTLHDLFATCPRHFRMPDARHFCGGGDEEPVDCAACVSADMAGLPAEELTRILSERGAALSAELAAADAVLAVSRPQADLLRSIEGFEREDLQVLQIGIRSDDRPAEAPEPVPGRLRIVNWAGLDPRKGVHLILEAVAASARPEAFEIHLHGREGDPEYTAELRDKAAGLDVRFHGAFEDAERWRFAARYDLAVFPFLAFETHGLVVDEALRSGIPVIVSDHGAPPERVGGRGLALPVGDAAALRDALEQLLDEPARLQDMRAATHSACDLGEHERQLRELYASLLTR